jgi:hypothetical protein
MRRSRPWLSKKNRNRGKNASAGSIPLAPATRMHLLAERIARVKRAINESRI